MNDWREDILAESAEIGKLAKNPARALRKAHEAREQEANDAPGV